MISHRGRGLGWTLVAIGFATWAVVSSASPVARTDGPAHGSVVATTSLHRTVRWQATTRSPGVVFRLYRGPNAKTLQLMEEIPAELGDGVYTVSDPSWSGVFLLYQLRVAAGRSGGEIVVAELGCVAPGMEAGEPAVPAGVGQAAVVAGVPQPPEPAVSACVVESSTVPTWGLRSVRPPPPRLPVRPGVPVVLGKT